MEPVVLRALLIGEDPGGFGYLAKRLKKQGCECGFAKSYQEACSRIEVEDFDLVLSPTQLGGEGLFPLMDLLQKSGSTLFYFYPVEDGCWWLPALQRGEKCFGSPGLRPSEFVIALDKAIEEMRLVVSAGGPARRAPFPQSAVHVLSKPSSRPETSPAGPQRVSAALVKRKAAG